MKRQNETRYDEFKNYYRPRHFKRFIQFERKVLNVPKLSIVHSKEEFKEKCNSEAPEKSIHYLQVQEGIKNQNLLWKKSNGPISDLDEFILKQEEFCFSVEQDKILDHGQNILIISAEPGMGKSTILDTFSRCAEEFFFLKIVLSSCENN